MENLMMVYGKPATDERYEELNLWYTWEHIGDELMNRACLAISAEKCGHKFSRTVPVRGGRPGLLYSMAFERRPDMAHEDIHGAESGILRDLLEPGLQDFRLGRVCGLPGRKSGADHQTEGQARQNLAKGLLH